MRKICLCGHDLDEHSATGCFECHCIGYAPNIQATASSVEQEKDAEIARLKAVPTAEELLAFAESWLCNRVTGGCVTSAMRLEQAMREWIASEVANRKG